MTQRTSIPNAFHDGLPTDRLPAPRERTWCRGAVAMVLFTLACMNVQPLGAQPGAREPHLAYAFPAGCQRGSSCEIVLGGQHIKDVKGAYVAGGGVQAEIVGWYRPMTRGEFNQLRMLLDDTRKKLELEGRERPTEDEVAQAAGVTAEQRREMDIFRQRDRDSKRQPNDQLEEQLTIKVTVADDAEPGKRELRLMTESAISNPLWIHVGQWPETRETEPNDTLPDAAIQQLPTVVNGQIMPGDTDTFAFSARQGDRLVIIAGARDVIPYLADAVPGWFQPTLTVTDEAGNAMPVATAFHFHQDPVVYFEVPRQGRYLVTLRDALYRGREDFVYRLTIGELPFVTSIFPLGTSWDERSKIKLEGWNLLHDILETKVVGYRQLRPFQWYTVGQGEGHSVRVPLKVDTLPELFDREPNNDDSTAQSVSTPAIVNGRIDAPGDEDVFRISGAGKLAIEVYARRHGSPVDSQVLVTDIHGKELAYNDDFDDKSLGLVTHHADSHLVVTIPPSGALVRLSDTQGNGGKEFVYRLYLRPPKPDFELRVTPASILARPGAIVPITVHALRKDEFDEDIELSLVDAPPGFSISGGVIPGNASRVQMTLGIPANAAQGPLTLDMAGLARLKRSRAVMTRPAIPAENMMQAFIWHHLIPVEQWSVFVSGNRAATAPFQVMASMTPLPVLSLPSAGESFLPIQSRARDVPRADLHLEVKDPKGVSAEIVTDPLGNWAIQFKVEPGKLTPGQRGNLLLYAYRLSTPPATAENPNPKPWRGDYGYLPAIPFEVGGKKPPR